MKKIMLIPPQELPIPNVGGGAIETLITNLLDVNEDEGRVRFVVTSKYDDAARKIKYDNSTIYYFKNDRYIGFTGFLLRGIWIVYRVWYEILQTKLLKKVIRSKPKIGFFVFQCLWIARKEKVDAVICEGRWDEAQWGAMRQYIGDNSFFTHIHCRRREDIEARTVVNNSISISCYVRDQWVVSKHVNGKNVVVYNGIDIKKMGVTIDEQEKVSLRENLGIDSNDFVVIFCGRIIKEKGVLELLDAFELLKTYPIKLLLIGSVDFQTNSITDYLKMVEKRVSKMPNIIRLGYVDNNNLPSYYAISNIQIVPSICEEGAGLVAVEGMAAGLPLITTISGGMVEYVNEDTSIQLPIDELLPENIANAIIELTENKKKREEMGRAGKERSRLFTKLKYYTDILEAVIGKNA